MVQLFNAVRQQQKIVDETLKKAGKSEIQREKILEKIDKKQFLDVLTKSVKSVSVNNDVKENQVCISVTKIQVYKFRSTLHMNGKIANRFFFLTRKSFHFFLEYRRE